MRNDKMISSFVFDILIKISFSLDQSYTLLISDLIPHCIIYMLM